MECISMPGHGATGNLKKGWRSPDAFQQSAEAIGMYIKELKDKYPKRMFILNAWSMGGVTALRIAAQYPGLLDGIVLMDTPAFPFNFANVAARFLTYGFQKTKKEDPLNLETQLTSIGKIFTKRILESYKKLDGMSPGVVMGSGRRLSKEHMLHEETDNLDETGQKKVRRVLKGIGSHIRGEVHSWDADIRKEVLKEQAQEQNPLAPQILLLHGTNHYIISEEQIKRLSLVMRACGGKLETRQIPGAGHLFSIEQPRKVGEILREWTRDISLPKQLKEIKRKKQEKINFDRLSAIMDR